MDIITHAVVGAVTGAGFGCPLSGALTAILPDVVLGFKRKPYPPMDYDITHSLPYWALFTLGVYLMMSADKALALSLCYLSHIILDLPTHGRDWAPPLLFPFSKTRYSYGEEWEWFSKSWWHGLELSFYWIIIVCLINKIL